MSEKIKWKFVYLFVMLLIMASAAGCNGVGSADMDMTVYADEKYEMTVTFRIPNEYLSMVGGTAEMENRLDEMVTKSADEGEKVSWKRDKSVPADEVGYIINVSGKGFDSSSDSGFSITPTVYDGQDALEFEGDFSDFAGLNSFSFTLHGSKIVESNGEPIEKGSVRWDSIYASPHAIFIPKGHINWVQIGAGLIVGLGCLGTLLAGGVIIFMLVRRNRKKFINI